MTRTAIGLLLLLTAGAGLTVGCGSTSGEAAVVTQTTTVKRIVQRRTVVVKPPRTETRTVVEPAPPPPPSATSYKTFDGAYVTFDYPDSWHVESSETSKGSYVDTTVRNPGDPTMMIRVDFTPSSSANAASSAAAVRRSLIGQPGYEELSFGSTTLNGFPAVGWEFLVEENGVLLHKRDVFFDDGYGNGTAVLTQASSDGYTAWRYVFAHVRQSVAVSGE
jgi:hypothetical protein